MPVRKVDAIREAWETRPWGPSSSGSASGSGNPGAKRRGQTEGEAAASGLTPEGAGCTSPYAHVAPGLWCALFLLFGARPAAAAAWVTFHGVAASSSLVVVSYWLWKTADTVVSTINTGLETGQGWMYFARDHGMLLARETVSGFLYVYASGAEAMARVVPQVISVGGVVTASLVVGLGAYVLCYFAQRLRTRNAWEVASLCKANNAIAKERDRAERRWEKTRPG